MIKLYQSIIIICLFIVASSNNITQIKQSNVQIDNDIKNMTSDSIFMLGYAIAVQEEFVDKNASVYKIFCLSQNQKVYGLYMYNQVGNVMEYYKFMFGFDEKNQQIQILHFEKSLEKFHPSNNEKPAQNIQNETKQTKKPKTNQISVQQAQKAKSKPIKLQANASSRQNLSYQTQKIDITSTYDKDIYFPKINLLLRSAYGKSLQNCQIQQVNYIISMNNSLINLITYTAIYYRQKDNQYYEYVVNIQNNNLQIIKVQSHSEKAMPSNSSILLISSNNSSSIFLLNNTKELQNDNPVSEEEKPSQSKAQISQNKTQEIKQNNITNTSNEIAMYRLISESMIKTQPKYKTLVLFVSPKAKIQTNSSLVSLEQWKYKIEYKNIYKFIFRINYGKPYVNNIAGKLTIIYVEEKVGIRTNIVNITTQDINEESNNNNGGQKGNVSMKQEGKRDGINMEQLTNMVGNLIKKHNPLLKDYKMEIIKYEKMNDLSQIEKGWIIRYNTSIILKNNKQSICFNVHCSAINTTSINKLSKIQSQNGDNVIINHYQLVKCQESASSPLLPAEMVNFKEITRTVDKKIIDALGLVHQNCSVDVKKGWKYQSYYRIKYVACNRSFLQIVLHQKKMAIIYYKRIIQNLFALQEKTDKKDAFLKLLLNKLGIYFNITQNHTQIETIDYLFQINTSKILKINGKLIKNSIFTPKISEYFTILALYQQNQNKIEILNSTKISLNQSNSYFSINFLNKQSWKEIPLGIKYKKYENMVSLMKKNYTELMNNATILAIYEPSQTKNQQNSISQQNSEKYKIVLKKVSNNVKILKSNNFYYAFVGAYNEKKSIFKVQSIIQNLKNDQISPNNCLVRQMNNNLERCVKCDENYRQIQGICHPIIKNCQQYCGQTCINCQFDYFQQQITKQCHKLNSDTIQQTIKIYESSLLNKL